MLANYSSITAVLSPANSITVVAVNSAFQIDHRRATNAGKPICYKTQNNIFIDTKYILQQ
jgi:hypothetical protein